MTDARRRPRPPGRDPGARGVGGDPAQGRARRPGWSAGRRTEVESILDIPLETGVPEHGKVADRLVAVPFRQVRERGFDAIDDGTPLVVVDIDVEHEVHASTTCSPRCRRGDRDRRPGRLRDLRRGLRDRRRVDHPRRDRPGRGRQPGHRPALPRRGRRLGAPSARSACSAGCSSASAGPTGPSASSPATASSSAPPRSGTSACATRTCG